MKVLAIETTCDETAAAVVENGREILSNVIASQSEFHEQFGGVFPEMAARAHVDTLIPVVKQALEKAQISKQQIDLIAVSNRPGLIGPLLIGLNGAKALSLALDKPFIGINHVEAHLYAAMMSQEELLLPAIGVVISGGHTFLTKILDVGTYEMIGTTVDDAVGEAFDKVATLLELPYPGGPPIEQLAKQGDPTKYPFKPGVVKGKPYDFSFSGLKTNVLYTIKGQNGRKDSAAVIPEEEKAHIAAGFQEAALFDIASKAQKAKEEFGCKAIYLGGGVSQNKRLREILKEEVVFWPDAELTVDNAAMIGGLAYHKFSGIGDPLSLEPITRSYLS